MKEIKRKCILGLLLCLVSVSSSYASIVTFEDEGSLGLFTIRDGYYGLNWGNFYAINGTESDYPYSSEPHSGYYNGRVSGDYVAWSVGVETSITAHGSLFTMNSVFLTAAWRDDVVINLTGKKNGETIFEKIFIINDDLPTFALLNYVGIDELVLDSWGGISNPNTLGDGDQFVIDDFTFNEIVVVPLPPAYLLVGSGLILLVQRKRKK